MVHYYNCFNILKINPLLHLPQCHLDSEFYEVSFFFRFRFSTKNTVQYMPGIWTSSMRWTS